MYIQSCIVGLRNLVENIRYIII